MKGFLRLLILSTLLPVAAHAVEPADSTRRDSVRKHPWIAGAEIAAINLGIMAYDHLVIKEPWYQVTIHSIEDNLKIKNWWWDPDYFHTNALNHPYHGALYYTVARDNNLDIATSSAFTLAGSLMWEIFCESEHPAINDIITTPIGGVALGEPMHRISSRIFDDSKRGVERLGRELLGTLINPAKGVGRLVRGESWRVRNDAAHEFSAFEASIGIGYQHTNISQKKNINTPAIRLDVTYGDIMCSEGQKPFDYFTLSLTAVTGSNQPLINKVLVKNQLWGKPIVNKKHTQTAIGIYHHYDYINVSPDHEVSREYGYLKPYGYMEIGAIGPGFAYRLGNSTRWEQQLFINGIALGSTPSETTHQTGKRNRGYSFGSGYGARLSSALSVHHWLRATVEGKFSQLFTWDGFYADDPSRQVTTAGISIQGEEGNAVTFIAEPTLETMPFQHFGIGLHGRYFWCHSNYKHHPHATTHSWELHAGVYYRF